MRIETETVNIYFIRFADGSIRMNQVSSSLHSAIANAALWIIDEKYAEYAVGPVNAPSHLPSCTCRADWDGCRLHDRRHGYFARLYKRLVKWISAGYFPGLLPKEQQCTD